VAKKKANKKKARKVRKALAPAQAVPEARTVLDADQEAAFQQRRRDRKHRPVAPESKGVLLLDPSVRLPRVSLDEFKTPPPFRLAGGKLRGRDKKPQQQENEPRRADDA
jgi:hypothetical protein